MPTTQYIRFGGGGNPEMAEMMRMRAEIWVWATDGGGFSMLHADVDRTPLPSPPSPSPALRNVADSSSLHPDNVYSLPSRLTLHPTSPPWQRFISNKFLLGLF